MGHVLCRALCALAIATTTVVGVTSCGDATDPPAPGSVRVTVATRGADPDGDGYFVVIDDSARQALAANGSVTMAPVRPGVRAVRLAGIATNCTGDDLEQTVSVTAGQVASVDFALQCVPRVGTIAISIATSGSERPTGPYRLTVDDGPDRAAGPDEFVTLADVHEGSHVVRLGDVAANCVVSDANPRMVVVSFGQTVATRFGITCQATQGRIDIVTRTTGVDLDADGYTARVSWGYVDTFVPVQPNETVRVDVPVRTMGTYVVSLQGVAPNCSVESVGWSGTTRHAEVTDDVPVQADFAITCAPSSTNRLPPGMVLAFSDAGRIARVDSDGSGLVRLTEGPSDDQPAWSPDGTRIAFTRTGAQSSDIYIMNADGSNIVRRTGGGSNADPAWSPDGKHIAFSAVADGSSNVYVMSADDDGKAATPVLAYPGFDAQPAWSPDGSVIALVSDWVIYDFTFDIFVATPDGSQRTQLTSGWDGTSIAQYYHPTWSPDGRKLAVVTCQMAYDTCGTSRLAIMNADGSGMATLMTGRYLAQPSWSPDGRTIAFSSDGTLRWIRADGSEQGTIGTEGRSPSWRP